MRPGRPVVDVASSQNGWAHRTLRGCRRAIRNRHSQPSPCQQTPATTTLPSNTTYLRSSNVAPAGQHFRRNSGCGARGSPRTGHHGEKVNHGCDPRRLHQIPAHSTSLWFEGHGRRQAPGPKGIRGVHRRSVAHRGGEDRCSSSVCIRTTK
jgi:hypothetical protein